MFGFALRRLGTDRDDQLPARREVGQQWANGGANLSLEAIADGGFLAHFFADRDANFACTCPVRNRHCPQDKMPAAVAATLLVNYLKVLPALESVGLRQSHANTSQKSPSVRLVRRQADAALFCAWLESPLRHWWYASGRGSRKCVSVCGWFLLGCV